MYGVFVSALLSALGAFLPRILAALGFVVFSEAVFRPYFDKLQTVILAQYTAIPSDYQSLIASTGLLDAIGIVFGAYFAAIGIKAAKSAFGKTAAG